VVDVDSGVAAAWIGIIPELAALLTVAIVVVAKRERLRELVTRITRLNVAGVEVDPATAVLREARPEQPVTERAATALEQRVARNRVVVEGRRVLWLTTSRPGSGASCVRLVCMSRT
jgi:hypothetical protein